MHGTVSKTTSHLDSYAQTIRELIGHSLYELPCTGAEKYKPPTLADFSPTLQISLLRYSYSLLRYDFFFFFYSSAGIHIVMVFTWVWPLKPKAYFVVIIYIWFILSSEIPIAQKRNGGSRNSSMCSRSLKGRARRNVQTEKQKNLWDGVSHPPPHPPTPHPPMEPPAEKYDRKREIHQHVRLVLFGHGTHANAIASIPFWHSIHQQSVAPYTSGHQAY